ncbi:N-acetylglucosamine-6-phosphate deacetylase [Thalassobacillus sp. CUG 92003]|uniref:N-acetylglucosamine-6-phosphate deacetylase n=1 Tax=Thalassobacillus sp. CUG 92003 TaxID=2736641 RepID=UPI0015E7B3E5|nr:N-acetylglucosamine-6-phosphate deacetylase [Thalassobacillus sp. CUG 92003]
MTARILITNIDMVLDDGDVTLGSMRIEDGVIKGIYNQGTAPEADYDRVIDANDKELVALPGFIDVHIHGANGYDTMDATQEAMTGMSRILPQEGTTSYLATTMTQSKHAIEKALKTAGTYIESQPVDGRAEVLGIHLEGPFISPEKPGAQSPKYIIDPDIGLFQSWQKLSQDHIKLVTLAPEKSGNLDLLQHLKQTGVVGSVGHSNASFEQVEEAVRHGASHITHLFNQMSPLHHRDPGVVGAAYLNHDLLVEMIVDNVHVRPEAIKLSYQLLGSERTALITDAMRAKCLGSGQYDLGGQEVVVHENEARLKDGTLAGSILTLNQAVKNLSDVAALSWGDIAAITSANVAKEMNVYHRKGSLTVGKDADIVLLDREYQVAATFCKGELGYEKEGMFE